MSSALRFVPGSSPSLEANFGASGAPDAPPACVYKHFEAHALRTPERIALVCAGESLTYGQLNARANALARRLLTCQAGPDALVVIHLRRSVRFVIAVLAVHKAGAAFLPIDPALPPERVAFMIRDSRAPVVITETGVGTPEIPSGTAVLSFDAPDWEKVPADNPESPVGPGHLAYVLYTSGSTGQPKGVMIEHQGLANLFLGTEELLGAQPDSVWLATSNFSFDISLQEYLWPLCHGQKVVIFRGDDAGDSIPALIRDHGVTHLQGTPSRASLLLEERGAHETLGRLRQLLLAGEALTPDLAARLHQVLQGELFNLYGPTETTIYSTGCRVPVGVRPVPIGRAIRQTQLIVVDEALHPVESGEAGELLIAGAGLARGYLNRPELTSERFLFHSCAPKGRAYRTGDLVRWRSDGQLDYLGRLDHQVKIRGYRIELGEIEIRLRELPAVQDAVVLARDLPDHSKELVAYLTQRGPTPPTFENLRTHLKALLPDYSVPAHYLLVAALPLTPSKKVDRKALAAAPTRPIAPVAESEPARDALETTLSRLWCEILGLQKVGIQERFHEVGGHSLLALKLVAGIRRETGVQLPWSAVFAHPTIASLATAIRSAQGPSIPVERDDLPRSSDPEAPASSSQQQMWVLHEASLDKATYTVAFGYRLTGRLNTQRLEHACALLVRRHDILRTAFHDAAGELRQRVLDLPGPFTEVIDLRDIEAAHREGILEERVHRAVREPFDMRRAPLWKLRVFQVSEEESLLLWTAHHALVDEQAVLMFFGELARVYGTPSGSDPGLAPIRARFADFAHWERKALTLPAAEAHRAFWKRQLDGAPLDLGLPVDHSRTPASSSRGGQVRVSIPPAARTALENLGRETGASGFVVGIAAFYALLHRLTAQTDIVIGTPVSGRHRDEFQTIVGLFLNSIPLRCQIPPTAPFRQVLSVVHQAAMDSFAHSSLPTAEIARVTSEGQRSRSAGLFRTMFVLMDEPEAPVAFADLRSRFVPVHTETAKFDLSLTVSATRSGGWESFLEYSRDLFEPGTAERIAGYWKTLVTAIAANPETPIADLDLVGDDERIQLLAWGTGPAIAVPEARLHRLISAQATRTPDAIAVTAPDATLTYRQLDLRANQLGHFLRNRGVARGDRVAICLQRSIALPTALLAVLKADGAYVLLDPDLPPGRLAYLLSDCRPKLLLTEEKLRDRFPADVEMPVILVDAEVRTLKRQVETDPPSEATPEDVAYVIYTSGSTGEPKGAEIPHRAICNYTHWRQWQFPLDATDVVLQKTAFSFDASVWEFWSPLAFGAQLVLAAEGLFREPTYLVEAIQRFGITQLQLVPTMLRALAELDGFGNCTSLRRVYCGGESLSAETIRRFRNRLPSTPLVNLYGPAEVTIDATVWECPPDWTAAALLGGPVANTRAYVLDDRKHLAPTGIPGELWLAGPQVARGYLGREALTRERFVPDPWGPTPAGLMYRSGDRVRWRPEGTLEFIGRGDSQIKVRGQRIEPGEIEAALAEHDSIEDAAVITRAVSEDDKELVGIVVPTRGCEPTVAELREHLKRRLPEAYIPTRWEQARSLPLNANGKLDRRVLQAQPTGSPLPVGREFAPPRTDLERTLAGLWSEVTGASQVGIDDDFFELGGHSLLAMKLLAITRERLGVEVPLHLFFRCTTLARFASTVESLRRGSSGSSEELLAPASSAALESIPPVERTGPLPLSREQERLWFLHHRLSEPATYHQSVVFDVRGPLDLTRFERALQALAQRHEILRTRIIEHDGVPFQQAVALQGPLLRLTPLELREGESREARLDAVCREEFYAPFDLATAPLWRVRAVQISAEDLRLIFVFCHLICDEWSFRLWFAELAALYAANDGHAGLPPLPIQYGDYAVWQRHEQAAPERDLDRAYWRAQLADVEPQLELPGDRARPTQATGRGGCVRRVGDVHLARAVARLARTERVSSFVVILAAFQSLLGRLCGHPDVVVGAPLAFRERPELQGVGGFFLNTLPLRARLDPSAPFRLLVQQLRTTVADAFKHGRLALDEIARCAGTERGLEAHRFLSAMLVWLRDGTKAPVFGEARTELVPFDPETAKFDLTLAVLERPEGGWEIQWEYNADIFDRSTIERFDRLFHTLLAAALHDPDRPIGELEWLSAPERDQMLAWAAGPDTSALITGTLPQRFGAIARTHASTLAIVDRDIEVTYGDLDARTNRLAHVLRAHGVTRGTPVGLHLDRSVDFIMSVLAVVKAGGIYVPMPTEYPLERLRFMAKDAALRLVLTTTGLPPEAMPPQVQFLNLHELQGEIARQPTTEVPSDATGEDVVYIMFTSGSTGEPKGVMIPHRAILRLVVGTDYLPWGPDQRILLLAATGFDASTFEIWGPLLHGGRSVVHGERFPTVASLEPLLRNHGVTTALFTTGLFNHLVDQQPDLFHSIRHLLIGGEALSLPHVQRVLAAVPRIRLINAYGPTEAATMATAFTIPSDGSVATFPSIPIGRPLGSTRCYVLDSQGRPSPIGVPGELQIGGAALALGYWNRPELTEEAFVPDPFSSTPGARLYRSGDRVRWRADGLLEFLGRFDNQVKVRGHRVEPGEVETALSTHPEVLDAAVVARRSSSGRELVAVIVPVQGSQLTVASLRDHLRVRLTDAMIPTRWETLPELPLTANGKLDRRRLELHPALPLGSAEPDVVPRTGTELALLRIWREVLGRETLTIHDEFFASGGHSLLAMKLVSLVRREFGVEVSLLDLFARPSVALLADWIASHDRSIRRRSRDALRGQGTGAPLFHVPGFHGFEFLPRRFREAIGRYRFYFDGLQYPGLDGREAPLSRIEDIAAALIAQLTEIWPEGPCCLSGMSGGGEVALEMACQLRDAGREVEVVLLYDSWSPQGGVRRPWHGALRAAFRRFANTERTQRRDLLKAYVINRLRDLGRRLFPTTTPAAAALAAASDESLSPRARVATASYHSLGAHQPRPYSGRVVLFKAQDENTDHWIRFAPDPINGWGPFLNGNFTLRRVPGQHLTLFKEPALTAVIEETLIALGHKDPPASQPPV